MKTRFILSIVLISMGLIAAILPPTKNSSIELDAQQLLNEIQLQNHIISIDEMANALINNDPEYQLIDDTGFEYPLEEWQKTGANYAMHIADSPELKPAGEWNTAKVLKDGDHVEHWLNGKKVVEYQLWTDDWKSRVESGKWNDFPAYGKYKRGHISLQDHGAETWFRNIKIREI